MIIKIIKQTVISIFVFSFMSCEEKKEELQGVNFGVSEYYDSFLFVKAKNEPVTKKLITNFNSWARQNNSYVDLQLIDQNDVIFNKDNFSVNIYANNVISEDGIVKIKSSENANVNDTLELKLLFEPKAVSDKYSGFITVSAAKVNRINNIDAIQADAKIFKWTAEFDVVMNPLKKGLIILFVIISIALLIWFIILRNIIYPKMKAGQIIINSPYGAAIKIKNARKIIFSNQSVKQKLLHKIFAGKIIYEVNQIWEPEMNIVPGRRKSLRIRMGLGYTINPFTSELKRGNSYELKKESKIIKISYL